MKYKLPDQVRHLIHARNLLREKYKEFDLHFTLDGNLVGDLGEAVAAKELGLRLVGKRSYQAVDAYDGLGRTVQIKATGRGKSIAFTHSEVPAERLIVLVFDYENEEFEVIFDGPYKCVKSCFPQSWVGQRVITTSRLRRLMVLLTSASAPTSHLEENGA